jgi:hypothetical protein
MRRPIPTSTAQVGLASEARPRYGSDVSGELDSDLSGDSTGHLRDCYPNTADPICNIMALLESDTEGDREVFMVGQGDALLNKQKKR